MACYGIDFGTCTSSIATMRSGRPALVADSAHREVHPSVIAHTPSGRTEIGHAAKARRLIDPENTVHSMKRLLGRKWMSLETVEFRRRYPIAIESGDDTVPRFVTRAGRFSALELATQYIAALCQLGNIQARDSDIACLAVPVAFDEAQRREAVLAAKNAGFKHVHVVEEPVAAAIEYLHGNEGAKRIAVYDLGGGTFDFAVLETGPDGTKVLAAGGDAYLGGDDIDLRCAEWAQQQVLEAHRWDVRSSRQCYAALVHACERAKILLSDTDRAVMALGQVDPVLEGKELQFDRSTFESMFLSLVQRTFIAVDSVMRDAGVRADTLDAVVIAGGCGYIPAVRENVQRYFSCTPRFDRQSDRVVALGALRHAETL